MREDERRVLAATEKQLQAENPELARKLSADQSDAPREFTINRYAGGLLGLTVLCVLLGEWFAALQTLAMAGVILWFREWPISG